MIHSALHTLILDINWNIYLFPVCIIYFNIICVLSDSAENQNTTVQHKKVTGRRREPRRHTLQNGIDYNMVSFQVLCFVIELPYSTKTF